jgi:hypothetical protein
LRRRYLRCVPLLAHPAVSLLRRGRWRVRLQDSLVGLVAICSKWTVSPRWPVKGSPEVLTSGLASMADVRTEVSTAAILSVKLGENW